MNYIKGLERDIKIKEAALDAASNGIQDLRVYLNSDKFFVDTTVQVRDVLNRLAEIDNAISDKENEA